VRWFFILLLLVNAIFYVSQKSASGFDRLGEQLSEVPVKGNIQLLSELNLAEMTESAPLAAAESDESVFSAAVAESGAEASSVDAEPALTECLVLGPYDHSADASTDQAKVPGAVVLGEEFERSADYWVYLGPYNNFDAASKMAGELKKKRIDSFAVRKGTLENAISLGVFTDPERAAIHAKGLLKKGYKADVKRVARYSERYWLAFTVLESKVQYAAAEAAMAELSNENKNLGEKSCNLIASYKELD
jgi:hypothetical protein